MGVKSRISKAKQKEKRIQQLEQEVAELKTAMSVQTNTIRIDERQMEKFLDELTARIEWSTNRIVDELDPSDIVVPSGIVEETGENAISAGLKYIMEVSFFGVATAVILTLQNTWQQYWEMGWNGKLAFIAMSAVAVDCILVGIAIMKEKDKSFIVAFFSAMVSLVALIVTLSRG